MTSNLISSTGLAGVQQPFSGQPINAKGIEAYIKGQKQQLTVSNILSALSSQGWQLTPAEMVSMLKAQHKSLDPQNLLNLVNQNQHLTPAATLAQMQSQLAQMKAFDHNIDELKKKVLNKTLLNQIIQEGYVQGGALAQSLAHGSASQIKDLNDTEKAIIAAAKKIGKDGADAMYDTGKNAGKGFLSGLKSEEKAIDKEMKKIADDIVKAIRKALRSKSPSMEMHDVGMDAARGLAMGLADGTPLVLAAAKKMAASVASVKVAVPVMHANPIPAQVSAGGGGGGAPVVIVHQHIAGSVLSEQQLQQHTQTAVLKYARRNSGNGLFLQGRASGAPVR